MSAVRKAVSGATEFLVGGKPNDKYDHGEAISSADQQRQDEIDAQLKSLYSDQGKSDPTTDLFRKHLTEFLTQGSNNPAQIKDATSFVDETFTNPAQAVVNQNVGDYQSQAEAKAAALGRNPNLDIATNQAIAGEGIRQNVGLQSQRGQMISQRYDQNFNRDLSSLNAGMQGSGFLNNLSQQAFSNRMALLNGRSSINSFNQADRLKNRTTGGGGTSSGLLTNLSATVGGFRDFGNTLSPSGGSLSGLGGVGGAGAGAGGGVGAGAGSMPMLPIG